jgi:hypothetical protein
MSASAIISPKTWRERGYLLRFLALFVLHAFLAAILLFLPTINCSPHMQ